jgi:hypothetical protein
VHGAENEDSGCHGSVTCSSSVSGERVARCGERRTRGPDHVVLAAAARERFTSPRALIPCSASRCAGSTKREPAISLQHRARYVSGRARRSRPRTYEPSNALNTAGVATRLGGGYRLSSELALGRLLPTEVFQTLNAVTIESVVAPTGTDHLHGEAGWDRAQISSVHRHATRDTFSASQEATMPRRDPICPVCELMIESSQLVSSQEGQLVHLRCYDARRLTKTKPPRRAAGREEPKRDDGSARG